MRAKYEGTKTGAAIGAIGGALATNTFFGPRKHIDDDE